MKKKWIVVLLGVGLVAFWLFGMICSLINYIQSAAARAQDLNNLRQIVNGIHGYAEKNRNLLPAASIPLAGEAPETRLSWIVAILPYIGEDSLQKSNESRGVVEL